MFLHLNKKYSLHLEIAGVSLSMESFQQWEEEDAFTPFVKMTGKADYQIIFRQTDELPKIPEQVIHEDECYRVHSDGQGGCIRSFFDAPRDLTPYAVGEYDHAEGRINITCLPKGDACTSEIHNSFFHIGFESILIHKRRLCLHAACVDTPQGGILFSGPSGAGKSTQAGVWCQYRGAREINGDRPILSKEEAGWFAWGSPYAGSSKCHLNENVMVKAIVMVGQAKECSIKRLNPVEAFRAIWSGLTIYDWDKWFVEEASNLVIELIGEVPVFQFLCTPNEEAVEYLERELRKEGCL